MKHFYFAVTVEQDINESILTERTNPEYKPGYYSYIVKCSESDNIKAKFESIGGLKSANLCPTKKRAEFLVNHWNACYKANGTYLFDNPEF
ncbi:MAG: hypothetical protein E7667_03035 [Ruminococcaceae bacterium]|nr:hypothetical protein [Oscillospiraceae bacterium]